MKKGDLQDFKINVKLKLSALWASVMFLYVYGDFFTLFVPGRIQELMNGESGAGPTTPLKLLIFSIIMVIPSLMIFLSVALKASLSRVLNIIFGTLYAAIMILVGYLSIGEWHVFYVFYAFVEVCLTLLIVWYAWRWERVEGEN